MKPRFFNALQLNPGTENEWVELVENEWAVPVNKP
jgi:hypothetical protein